MPATVLGDVQAPIACPSSGCKGKMSLGSSLQTEALRLPESKAEAQVRPQGLYLIMHLPCLWACTIYIAGSSCSVPEPQGLNTPTSPAMS